MATLTYKLTAFTKVPEFAAERRYILTEKALATRQAEKSRGLWPVFSIASLGLYKAHDWHTYIRALDGYAERLDHHENEISNGLVPLYIDVQNLGDKTDSDIQIHLIVSRGSIHPKMKPPARPSRMDGAINAATAPHFKLPSPGGFSRNHIRISQRGVEAQFSNLASLDNALLVNRILYFSANEDSRLAFTVMSRNVPTMQRGFVDVEN
jgi:hypothetical protein